MNHRDGILSDLAGEGGRMNHRDGIQVDNYVRIGYNIAYQAEQMLFVGDNFSPSFAALGAIRDHPLLYRCIWRRGYAFVEYA